MQQENIRNPFQPIYNKNSKILILGTMPSPKSRENGFYYMHPQNKFWRVLSVLFKTSIPQEIDEKITFLLSQNVALWDVLESCTITGASDSSIKDPVVNDISSLLKKTNINTIFTTGAKAHNLYKKYVFPATQIEAISLPSTSPANQGNYSFEDLVSAYSVILPYLL